MQHTYEVHAYVPGAGHIGVRIMADSSANAQRAVLAQYPNASITYVKQLD